MEKYKYNIISAFEYNGVKMLTVRTNGAACIMSERDYNRIIIAERKYRHWQCKRVVNNYFMGGRQVLAKVKRNVRVTTPDGG